MPGTKRYRSVHVLVAATALVCLLAAACSSGGGSAPSTTTPTVRVPPGDGVRLQASAAEPLFLLNVAIDTTPAQVRSIVEHWPSDLRWMLGFQVIYDAHNPLPEDQRGPALDRILTVTDASKVPTLVQVGTFLGWDGPTRDVLDAGFRAHPSLSGISLAELSAGTETAISGLTDDQKAMVLDAMNIAVANKAAFLWADMGYVGPQVFVSAGADPRIATLMEAHPENMIIQAKQNGLGRRFGTWSAAFGFYAAGLAGAWGVNSEDWLWWEASLQKLYGPQVQGGLTITGMVKSDFPNRARLTYPEALYGTEMLVAASSGASVFSVESPDRVMDPATQRPTATAEKVLFPVLRRITRSHLIPTRSQVHARIAIAYQPQDPNPPELAWDQAFTGLYGPDGCTTADQVACAQRQWLPSTGRYGIIPTLPVLTPAAATAKFPRIIHSLAGTEAERRATFDAVDPAVVGGDSWAAPGAARGSWFLANPNENADVTSTFQLPEASGTTISGTLSPQSFAVLTTSSDRIELLVDNDRSDSDPLWTPTPTSDLTADQTSAGPPAPPAESRIVVRVAGRDEPKVVAHGGRVERTWNAGRHELTITLSARGPVTLDIRFGD